MNIRYKRLMIVAVAILCMLAFTKSMSQACVGTRSWTADLVKPGVKNPSAKNILGSATMAFDYQRPLGTMTVVAPKVTGVERIEVRAVRFPGDVYGPPIALIYQPKDGPFRGKTSKFLQASDIIGQSKLQISTARDVAIAMVGNRAVVAVCTKNHPKGEMAGVIVLHQAIVYSNKDGSFHDPKLHKLHHN